MPTLEIEVPKQALDHLHMEPSEFALAMKTMAALKMYELGQLSSREAAALAGVSRGEFLQLLRTYQIPPFERVDATGAPIRPVHELSDAEVLRLATMQMPTWQNRRLHELLEHQREGQLTTEEQVELDHLLRLHDSALLLKSEAMVEAVRRGLCEAGSGA
jgi:predicted HTH domain antitoxin